MVDRDDIVNGRAGSKARGSVVGGARRAVTAKPARGVSPRRVHGWRKLAGAAWGPPSDPQFYGDLEIDAGSMLDYVARARHESGEHVTVTHLVGCAVAHGLSVVPELRVRIARGREVPRDSTDVFFIVTAEGGEELTGVKVDHADEKSAVEVAREVAAATEAIGQGSDAEFGRLKGLLDVLPPRLLRPTIRLGAWLTSDLDLDLPRLGLRRQPFGGAMITSVGMWGVGHAYSPLAAYYRVPVLVLVGQVEQRPAVVAGSVVARPILTLTATFDHRYVDGIHAARFSEAVHAYCRDPARYDAARDSMHSTPLVEPDAG